MCVSNGGDICCFVRKYYLVDSGYAVKKGYLGPYRNARYHLDEFRDSVAPTGYDEQFNFCHSSLCNVIKRAFGRLKGKWHILALVPYFERVKQTKLIIACFCAAQLGVGTRRRKGFTEDLAKRCRLRRRRMGGSKC